MEAGVAVVDRSLRIGEVKWVYRGTERPKWKSALSSISSEDGRYAAGAKRRVDMIRISLPNIGSPCHKEARGAGEVGGLRRGRGSTLPLLQLSSSVIRTALRILTAPTRPPPSPMLNNTPHCPIFNRFTPHLSHCPFSPPSILSYA